MTRPNRCSAALSRRRSVGWAPTIPMSRPAWSTWPSSRRPVPVLPRPSRSIAALEIKEQTFERITPRRARAGQYGGLIFRSGGSRSPKCSSAGRWRSTSRVHGPGPSRHQRDPRRPGGALYRKQHRYAEAEPLARRGASTDRRLAGSEHRLVCVPTWPRTSSGRVDWTRPSRSISGHRGPFPETDHPQFAALLHNLSELHRLQGRLTEAESTARSMATGKAGGRPSIHTPPRATRTWRRSTGRGA